MKTQLLCTFTNQKNLEQITHDITKNFDIVFNKIYVLQNEDNTKELICTYNVDDGADIDFNYTLYNQRIERINQNNK